MDMNRRLLDDDHLIDNAACASQLQALVDEKDTRRAIKDNVCAPLRAEIAKLHAELKAVLQLAVDKWLDDEEGNPATRAARAREVALKAIEAAERKRDELVAMVRARRDEFKEHRSRATQPAVVYALNEILADAQPKSDA